MAEAIVLTDATLDTVLNGNRAALILVGTGEGLRTDFVTAFKQAADKHPDIVFARIDPASNPQAAARFDVGSKPAMIGWYNCTEVLRRPRPWGTDVPLAIEQLQSTVKENQPIAHEESDTPMDNTNTLENVAATPAVVYDKPVHVTDATFESEVLNSELPVLVDFWAEWCGPCRMVAPTLDKLAGEFAGQVKIAKVNVDENPGLSQAFRVMSIPTIMLIKQRTIVFSQPGALPEPAFRDLIQQLIALELPPQTAETQEQPAD
jgi:thioredoxin 1